MTLTKKHKHLLIGYGVVTAVYYFQAKRLGLNPSLTTALEWPLWLVKSPSGTLGVLVGSGSSAAGNI